MYQQIDNLAVLKNCKLFVTFISRNINYICLWVVKNVDFKATLGYYQAKFSIDYVGTSKDYFYLLFLVLVNTAQ